MSNIAHREPPPRSDEAQHGDAPERPVHGRRHEQEPIGDKDHGEEAEQAKEIGREQ